MIPPYTLHPVPDDLLPYVSAIWTLDSAGEPWEEQIWPSLAADVVFGATPYETEFGEVRETVTGSSVHGVTLAPRRYRHGVDRLTGLQFQPGALSTVLGDVTAARDALLPVSQRAIFEAPDPRLRAAAAARWVREQAPSPTRARAVMQPLMQHRSVDAAAKEIGVSVRTLHRQTLRLFGLSPKELQRLCRFRSTLPALRRGTPYADVALEAGYYDQAHFCREFAAFTQLSPSQAFPRS